MFKALSPWTCSRLLVRCRLPARASLQRAGFLLSKSLAGVSATLSEVICNLTWASLNCLQPQIGMKGLALLFSMAQRHTWDQLQTVAVPHFYSHLGTSPSLLPLSSGAGRELSLNHAAKTLIGRGTCLLLTSLQGVPPKSGNRYLLYLSTGSKAITIGSTWVIRSPPAGCSRRPKLPSFGPQQNYRG